MSKLFVKKEFDYQIIGCYQGYHDSLCKLIVGMLEG